MQINELAKRVALKSLKVSDKFEILNHHPEARKIKGTISKIVENCWCGGHIIDNKNITTSIPILGIKKVN